MAVEDTILYIVLALAFVLAAIRGVGIVHPRWHLGWLALAVFILAAIIDRAVS